MSIAELTVSTGSSRPAMRRRTLPAWDCGAVQHAVVADAVPEPKSLWVA